MNDLRGKLVKLFFKNGMVVEGRVRSWSPTISVLGVDNPLAPGYLIIHETMQNVMMVRVLEVTATKPSPVSWQEPLADGPPQLPPGQAEADPVMRARKLAEIRKRQIQEHKTQLSERLQRGTVAGASTTEVNYEYPNLSKLKPVNRTKSQTSRRSGGNSKKL
jgi:hypothetical protein